MMLFAIFENEAIGYDKDDDEHNRANHDVRGLKSACSAKGS